jgi:hypothetical protein
LLSLLFLLGIILALLLFQWKELGLKNKIKYKEDDFFKAEFQFNYLNRRPNEPASLRNQIVWIWCFTLAISYLRDGGETIVV